MDAKPISRRVHLRPDYLDELSKVGGPIGLSNLVNAALCVAIAHPEEVKEKVSEIRALYGPGKVHTRWSVTT
jgi:hypothetical protein